MAEADPIGDVTVLLEQWKSGNQDALERLIPIVHRTLHNIAVSYLRQDRPGHTLEATALVNELYLRLIHQKRPDLNDRAHFFAFAAKLMRMILIDYSRANRAQKRGGNTVRLMLTPDLPWFIETDDRLMDLELALQELEQLDAQKARLVEMRYFLGCTAEEAAELLDSSKATVDREMKFVRSWLLHRLRGGPAMPIPAV